MRTTAFAAALLAPSVAFGDPALFCAGTWSVVSGNVTGIASGGRIDLVRTTDDGPATLSYDGCDAASMTIQGRTMTLNRGADGRHWTATTPGGGGTLHFRFDLDQPGAMAARMSTSDGQLTVLRGSRMSLTDAAAEQPLECFDEADTEIPVAANMAEGFASAIGKRAHPDHTMRDYYRSAVIEAGDEEAGVLPSYEFSYPLALSMEMLPRVAGADMFRAACDGRKLEPVRKILAIKVYPVDPGYTAFARIIDVETGKIETQAEGQSDGQAPQDAIAAMRDAYSKLGAPASDMGDVWAQ